MRVAAALLCTPKARSRNPSAEIAGISPRGAIDELSRRRISLVDVTPEELQEEIDRE
jgi:predicted HTH domain antitoxin